LIRRLKEEHPLAAGIFLYRLPCGCEYHLSDSVVEEKVVWWVHGLNKQQSTVGPFSEMHEATEWADANRQPDEGWEEVVVNTFRSYKLKRREQ
jgi:hypothetical protein